MEDSMALHMLEVLEGVQKGLRCKLDAVEHRLGRDATCVPELRDRKASRKHALLSAVGDMYRITDLDSTNGTFLNGHRVSASVHEELAHGDIIKIGNTKLLYIKK